MKIYILMDDERIAKVSCNKQKMHKLAEQYNGSKLSDELFFESYYVIGIKLEDFEEK